MAYYLDLFSPETYEAFGHSDRTTSGFRPRQRNSASKIQPGDKLVCYMTRLSRWIGILEVVEGPFDDESPIFYPNDDPFTLRFRVRPAIWLSREKAVPIHEDVMWNHLTFTHRLSKNSGAWTGRVRASLGRLDDADGKHIEQVLQRQLTGGVEFPVEEAEFRKLIDHRVRRADRKNRSLIDCR